MMLKSLVFFLMVMFALVSAKTTSLGILDIQYSGEDNSKRWIGAAIMEACRLGIEAQPEFNVTPPRQMRLHRDSHKKGNKPQDLYRFGEFLNLDFLLSGEFFTEDKNVRVTLNLWNVRDQRMETIKETGAEEKLFALSEQLAAAALKLMSPRMNFSETPITAPSERIFGIYAKGMEQYALGNLPEAVYSTRRVLDLAPSYVPALLLMTDLYLATQDQVLALETAKKAVKVTDGSCEAVAAHARALLSSGDAETALKELKENKSRCQGSFALNDVLGQVYLAEGFYTIAISCFVKAISVSPGLTRLYFLTGKAYLGSEEYDKAIKSFSRAVELEPGNSVYRCMLGVACREGGDIIRAVKILEDLKTQDPGYLPALFHLAACYNQLEWYKMSVQLLSKAYLRYPDSPDLAVGLGVTYLKMGEQKTAGDYFSKAMALDDKSPLVLNNTGVYYLEKKDFKQAATYFLRAYNINKRDPGIAYNLAVTYYRMGQLKWSKEYLTQVLESSPRHLAARKLLVELYQAQGEPENAMSVLAEIISLDNNDYAAKVAYAQLLLKIGEQEQGTAVLEDVVKNNPGNVEYLALLTAAYRNLGWFDIAILKLSKFLEKNEKSAALLTLLGEAYYGKALMNPDKVETEASSKALYYLKEAHSLAGNSPETVFWYAKALFDCKNDAAGAVPLFKKVLTLSPEPEIKKEAEAYLRKKS